MKKIMLALALITILSGCVSGDKGSAPSAQTATSPDRNSPEWRLFELINIERAKRGNDLLTWDDRIASAARAHSEDMLLNNFLRDRGSDGSIPSQWLGRVGADDVVSPRVFVYRGDNTPEQMLATWENLPNVSDNSIGIGIVPHPEGSADINAAYWTLIIGEIHRLRLIKPLYSNVPVTSVSVRHRHGLAIRADSTLWGWGYNFFGALGNGTRIHRYFPVQAGTDSNWALVSSSSYSDYSFGIKTDGTLWAWGSNGWGQLGDGTREHRLSPVQIGTDRNWASVSAGAHHALAVKTDGTLWAWGSNSDGSFGAGTPEVSRVPIRIGTERNWGSISAGGDASFAIKTNGTLWEWGHLQIVGSHRRLITIFRRNTPLQVGTANNWVYVSANNSHVVALRADGTLWAWGSNLSGQLGIGSNDDHRMSPVQIGTDRNWASVSAGDAHTVAIKTDGTLWAWGDNMEGQLGNGTTTNRNVPVQIGTDRNWAFISAGDSRTAAIKTDGTLWTWGDNAIGIGDGRNTTTESHRPVQVMP
jgi:alpha-tubulin suppressor-like RCC1 family protein